MTINWINWIVGGHASDKKELPERTSTREPPAAARLIDADETLVGEFARARRYEQTLTIVAVSAAPRDEDHDGRSAANGGANGQGTDSNGALEDSDEAVADSSRNRPDVLPLLAAVGLREALRESDVLCYRPMEGRFVLGLPQSDGDEARQAMDRVGELFHRRLRIDLIAGAASFPADGLTLEDLERTANERAEPVGAKARSGEAGNARPARKAPTQMTRPPSRGRNSRTGAPSETAREAIGSE